MYLGYHTVVVLVLVFLVLAGNAGHYFPAGYFGINWEIVFGVTYVLSVQYSCAVVSVFFVVAGKFYYDRKKKF